VVEYSTPTKCPFCDKGQLEHEEDVALIRADLDAMVLKESSPGKHEVIACHVQRCFLCGYIVLRAPRLMAPWAVPKK